MSPEMILKYMLFAALCIAAVEDIAMREIHLQYVGGFFILGCLGQFLCSPVSFLSFGGGIGVGALLYLISLVWSPSFGAGDAYIIGMCGAYLGFFGTLYLCMGAFLLAAFVGLLVILQRGLRTGRIEKGMTLPFVPFLMSVYAAMLIAERLK